MYSAVCQIFGYERELAAAYKRIQQLENRALRAERQRDAALDKATEQRYHLYEAETALEEEKGKNLRLMTQINKDFENSSLPLEIIKAYKKLQEVKKMPQTRMNTTFLRIFRAFCFHSEQLLRVIRDS